MAKNKKFMYGIGEVRFGEKTIGYIEKGSWDWGGTKPEKTDVEAEQVPTGPVLTLMQKNGTIAPTSTLSSWTTRTCNSPSAARSWARQARTPAGKPPRAWWSCVTSAKLTL